jgi:hypothetical protein
MPRITRLSVSGVTPACSTLIWQNVAVPPIHDQILKSTVYLYRDVNDAMNGVRQGGTGFAVSYPFSRDAEHAHYYFVTTDHLARGAPIVRFNMATGAVDVKPYRVTDWLSHPDGDDIAVARFLPDSVKGFDFLAINVGAFLTPEAVSNGGILTGEDVYMIGRYINHDGEQRNLPTARFGSIAMMPLEKIKHRGLLVDMFLVDMRSLSGYSGSPVIVDMSNANFRNAYRQTVEESPLHRITQVLEITESLLPLRLVGIDCGHASMHEQLRTPDDEIAEEFRHLHVRSNAGIAHVSPAWKILEVLNLPEFVKRREEDEERYYGPRSESVTDQVCP